ncbi:unnamed protein product [Lampetra fluviatilis]
MALRPDNPAWHGGLARCHHHRQFAAPRGGTGDVEREPLSVEPSGARATRDTEHRFTTGARLRARKAALAGGASLGIPRDVECPDKLRQQQQQQQPRTLAWRREADFAAWGEGARVELSVTKRNLAWEEEEDEDEGGGDLYGVCRIGRGGGGGDNGRAKRARNEAPRRARSGGVARHGVLVEGKNGNKHRERSRLAAKGSARDARRRCGDSTTPCTVAL